MLLAPPVLVMGAIDQYFGSMTDVVAFSNMSFSFGYGRPGQGGNGAGLNGVYYDHRSCTYRSVSTGEEVSGPILYPGDFENGGQLVFGKNGGIVGCTYYTPYCASEVNNIMRQIAHKDAESIISGLTGLNTSLLSLRIILPLNGNSLLLMRLNFCEGIDMISVTSYLGSHAAATWDLGDHQCGSHMVYAFIYGGATSTNWKGAAYQDGPYILGLGYHSIDPVNYYPHMYDVTIFDPSEASEFGHIQMRVGNEWVSNVHQGDNFWPCTCASPNYIIYRLNGQ